MEEEKVLNSFKSIASKPLRVLNSNWRPPKKYRWMSIKEANEIREQNRILAEGLDLLAPMKSFKDMRLPKDLIEILKEKGIKEARGIQMQCLPEVLSGKDVIAIAPSGSGKSLIFFIQALVLALEEEKTMSIIKGEGPFCLVILPSVCCFDHELAIQTYENFAYFAEKLSKRGYPSIKTMLCIGGIDMGKQLEAIRKGVHIVVGTPGRLSDLLNKKKFNLDLCELLVLDEADRLLDTAFEDELIHLFSNLESRRQILLISSTIPKKIQEFAKMVLTNPSVVSTSQKAALNMNVVQEVEYVKSEDKLPHLLESLKKTPPPVLIFCENKNDVDAIHEYLLLKMVDTAGLHGGKDQEERSQAIQEFKKGRKDVLVATDVAAKGLDFSDIKHVINFSMPREINNYLNRIARAGRGSATGLATTFINRGYDQGLLLELKEVLIQCGQPVPPFIKVIQDPDGERIRCGYCGIIGHNMRHCEILERQRLRILAGLESEEK